MKQLTFAALLACLLWAGVCHAGPLDTGDAAYAAGNYTQAVSAYQAAESAASGPELAKIYYKLGNAHHKLGQNAQALAAYQQAQSTDPSLSFASSPAKFQRAVARVSSGSRAQIVPRAGGSVTAYGRDAAYQALTGSNVYVAPDVTGVNSQALDQAAVQGRDTPHTLVKIAVVDHLPPGYASAAVYAGKLHQSLALGRNGMVAVALRGSGAGVGVSSELGESDNQSLATQYAPQIAQNPGVGTAALAQAVAAEINNKEYRGQAYMWIVFLIVVAFVAFLLISGTRRRKAQLNQVKAQIAPLRQYVLESIGYVDGYVDVLPKNNPDSDTVRSLRQSASEKYDQADKIMATATAETDMARAQNLLASARADIDNARKALDRALGNTSNIAGDEALRPKPLPETQEQVAAVPQGQRGASFFSSQPAPLSSLVPVTVTVNGQSKQVLATPEEADELRQGRMPQVRTFNVGGQQIPWYAYDRYDPYNDYWRYQNSGWGGFGGGVLTGLVGAELLGDLFAPHYGYGGGYSPYAYSTDNDYYRGYYDNERQDNAYGSSFGNWGDNNAPDNAGGASFMNDSGPGYDTQGYGSGGGGSFMGSDSS